MADRAVSTSLNFALSLAIAAILITGLIAAGGTYVNDQRTSTIRTELHVVGQQVISDLNTADRLARTTTGTASVEQTLPRRVAGSPYTVEVVAAPEPYLVLSTRSPSVTVEINVTNQTEVAPSVVAGGPVEVRCTGACDVLEVTDG